ncbi:hypothetical protein PsAD2_02522 [Pseudovibrio axinellae]|uniref:Uncharacterized protein n=1 Tax=Pseudovibrio axinellae TaxID=989403 RepID=A0A165YN29_9HYPH|nr:DUF6058 family natural product biosynthesis protein [Pseudovibrio axinellae]KZL19003.1 hypothetical protein PsAD2_02522 [Pseudovibrio axinellae]SEP84304.1 hypothetical protein SAMN05421798_101519 [Pseudovibrio axinellae]
MLLNYLYSNFYEEHTFIDMLGVSAHDLQSLQVRRLMPAASYLFTSASSCTSFPGDYQDQELYRFHQKGHHCWFTDLQRYGLTDEQAAKAFFLTRFRSAKTAFQSGELGGQLQAVYPDAFTAFDSDLEDRTWDHFLNGTYGLCTFDGQPETIFLKQAGVRFIKQIIMVEPAYLPKDHLEVLQALVDLLDRVESNFAPHEVAASSRQSCIIDVRKRYLATKDFA